MPVATAASLTPAAAGTSDRRKSERLRFPPEGRSRLTAARPGYTEAVEVRNISTGGISLVSTSPVALDEAVLVYLYNPARDFRCRLGAQVVYTVTLPAGGFIVGCAFSRPLSRAELEKLL